VNRRSVLVIAAMLLLAAAGYLIGRSGSPPSASAVTTREDAALLEGAAATDARRSPSRAPVPARSGSAAKGTALPPSGTPLKDVFSDLQARADAGDAAAASRLFRDLNSCSRMRVSEWRSARATDELTSKKTEGMSPEQLRTYQVLLDAMEVRQRAMERKRSLCEGVTDAMLDNLVADVHRAAQLGDADARACYLSRGPTYDARNLLNHPDSLESYRNSASSLIEAGLAAGDWKVVDLLREAYEPGAEGLLAGLLGADAYQYYRYLKLYRLGAESHRATRLDEQLASAAANLTTSQVAEADEWAQSHLRNFRGPSTAGTPQGWDPCAFADN
jgi:hypothetical protein